jgi:DNA helicase HerA-like ATPase
MYSLGVTNKYATTNNDDLLNDKGRDYALIENENKSDSQDSHLNKKPKYVVILLDEVNRFLPNRDLNGNPYSNHLGIRSSVGEELFKTILAGRSRHCILFTAQQFKSQIDPGINENTGLHILAKLGHSELSTKPYNMVDDVTKSIINKLHKGEFVLVHSAFKHPIKITIPKPSFKKP